jgi:hypothetical protein
LIILMSPEHFLYSYDKLLEIRHFHSSMYLEKDASKNSNKNRHAEDNNGGVREGHVPEGVEREHEARGANEAARNEGETRTLGKRVLLSIDENGDGWQEDSHEATRGQLHRVDVDQEFDYHRAQREKETRDGGQKDAEVRHAAVHQLLSARVF